MGILLEKKHYWIEDHTLLHQDIVHVKEVVFMSAGGLLCRDKI
jgi:hypothetical protein